MIDTHCHLTHSRIADDFEPALRRAAAAGVEACVTIGTGVADAEAGLELRRRAPGFVFCTAGIDPFHAHAAGAGFDAELERLEELLAGGGFVAVGEIGLDYYYDLDPREIQIARFAAQLDLAARAGLPVVIHVREAHEDMAAVLAEHPEVGGVIHSFTAGPPQAKRYLELGWLLAFNGVLTFKNSHTVRDVAGVAPVDRLLVETDSPYLAPVPVRGQRCEPAHVAHTLRRLAEIRGVTLAEMDARTTDNARRLFGLPAQVAKPAVAPD